MDGETSLLSAHCRTRWVVVPGTWQNVALHLCRHHRRNVRVALPTRCARLRIKCRLGNGVRHLLVVSWTADAQVTLARPRARLVARTRTGTFRVALWPHRLWLCRGRDLRCARQTLGRFFY